MKGVMKGVMNGGWGLSASNQSFLQTENSGAEDDDDDDDNNLIGGGWVTIPQ